MPELDDVLERALRLDARDRASLAERLLTSLDELTEEEAERLWTDEAERRLEAHRAGRASTTSSERVHARARDLLE